MRYATDDTHFGGAWEGGWASDDVEYVDDDNGVERKLINKMNYQSYRTDQGPILARQGRSPSISPLITST
jgi:hypothetical protein